MRRPSNFRISFSILLSVFVRWLGVDVTPIVFIFRESKGSKNHTKLTQMLYLTTVNISEETWDAVTSLDNVNFQFDLRLND